jgi:DNA modification methylase
VSLRYHIGDTLDLVRQLPDNSVDLIVTSPPFLALRSYLPADHPDKHREIGSEPTPADFLDTLLGLTGEWLRVLAPHGSICVELGDTYAGSGGAGVTNIGGRGDGRKGHTDAHKSADAQVVTAHSGSGWPLAKSLTGIPTLYTWSLAYGRNLLNGNPAPQLRVRNVIVWARPNPPVGALGDKFRPATSYITVACKGPKRYFDLDAVRLEATSRPQRRFSNEWGERGGDEKAIKYGDNYLSDEPTQFGDPAGAPPLDWHADDHPEDGDWLWKMSTQPYRGSHYATFPLTLPKRLIEAMCPLRVCVECGKPSERITERTPEYAAARDAVGDMSKHRTGERFNVGRTGDSRAAQLGKMTSAENVTLGWTDCGHGSHRCVDCGSQYNRPTPVCQCGSHDFTYLPDHYRTGVVLDPFAGSGTTLDAAQAVGRHAIGFDLDDRNADLARDRVGMFLEIVA